MPCASKDSSFNYGSLCKSVFLLLGVCVGGGGACCKLVQTATHCYVFLENCSIVGVGPCVLPEC
jgi:hypothetical protein